ncbi:MAG: WYL domain-containing protein [Propionibacteriaceae bacterium]|jgi:proteasome accessory factor C|nr:WYL domain-containing protein [Propionibacteriaceae bacterium]
MATSRNQLERLLTLVPYLQAHPGVRVADVAQAFGVDGQQIIKDLEVAYMVGLPGGLPSDLIEVDMDAARDAGEIYLSNAEFLSRPVRLYPDEAASLIVALEAVLDVASDEASESAASALEKLVEITGAQPLAGVDVQVSSGDEILRASLSDAITAGRRVQLSYSGATRGINTSPLVDPVRLDLIDGETYLVGFSVERNDWRTFRLGRIGGVQICDQPSEDHGAAPERRHTWSGAYDDAASVTLDLAPEAAWLPEYFAVRSTSLLEDGKIRVELGVVNPDWLTDLLLQLGPAVLAVNPPEAASVALAEARAALALHLND